MGQNEQCPTASKNIRISRVKMCPMLFCHGSQTLRFIWCSNNKLDSLALFCMHFALRQPEVIEAQHACKAEVSTSAVLRNMGP